MKLRLGLALGSALALAGPTAAHAVIDLVGRESATFSWSPATGPVTGYSVYVSRNGGPEERQGSVIDRTDETVYGAYGDSVVVRVAATDATGNEGPLSLPSETVRFVAPPPPPAPGPARRDFDGDGLSDLWLTEPDTGRGQLWSVDADGFELLGDLATLPSSWSIVATLDADGDGSSDLLWRSSGTGRLDLWLVVDGTLVGGDMVRGPLGPEWQVATAGDFDSDGRGDILLWHPGSGALELWLMQGTEIAEVVPWASGPSGEWTSAGGGDYDGDGLHDVLWRHPNEGRLEAWLVRSPRDVEQVVFDDALDPGWTVEGSGDADGDGDDEVLLRHRAWARLEARELDGGVVVFPSPPDEDELAGLGDFDGDGRLDLLWRVGESDEFRVALSSDGEHDVGDPWNPAARDEGDPPPASCDGDLDGDGRVGIADFMALRRCYGDPDNPKCARADLDGDGTVGPRDFNLFRQRYGASCP